MSKGVLGSVVFLVLLSTSCTTGPSLSDQDSRGETVPSDQASSTNIGHVHPEGDGVRALPERPLPEWFLPQSREDSPEHRAPLLPRPEYTGVPVLPLPRVQGAPTTDRARKLVDSRNPLPVPSLSNIDSHRFDTDPGLPDVLPESAVGPATPERRDTVQAGPLPLPVAPSHITDDRMDAAGFRTHTTVTGEGIDNGVKPFGDVADVPESAGSDDVIVTARPGDSVVEEDSRQASAGARQNVAAGPAPSRNVPAKAERQAGVGETVEIELPGPSWLYLGSNGEVDFLGRDVDRETNITRFSFRITGPVELQFESQDLTSGSRYHHVVAVAINDDSTFAGSEGIAADPAQTGATRTGGALSDGTASGSGTGETALFGEPGDERSRQQVLQPEGAEDVFEVLAAGATPGYDGTSHQQILEAIRSEDGRLASVSEDTLLKYVGELDAEGRHEAATDVLDALWENRRYRSDVVLYHLARSYDVDRPLRDVKRARDLYELLQDEYPFSEYFEPAKEREAFLNRHFFHIR